MTVDSTEVKLTITLNTDRHLNRLIAEEFI